MSAKNNWKNNQLIIIQINPFLKSNYHGKIRLLEAELTFEKLADKIGLI